MQQSMMCGGSKFAYPFVVRCGICVFVSLEVPKIWVKIPHQVHFVMSNKFVIMACDHLIEFAKLIFPGTAYW